ncbi:hypothetical protein BT96DRAFT_797840, partial [Gymnopus androsaceus JB14]
MGAFSQEHDVTSTLYRVGIPVWYVRPIEDLPFTRVDSQVTPETCVDNRLPIRFTTETIDISPSVPPHPIIYIGLSGSYDRYVKMGSYLYSFF